MPDHKSEESHHRRQLFSSAEETFDTAVKAFNPDPTTGQQDPETLRKTLDRNVIVYRLNDGTEKYKGIDDVFRYLTTGPNAIPPGIAGSKFEPLTKHPFPTKVRGRAKWTDIDGNTDNPFLVYDFDFDHGSYLLKKFYAIPEN